MWNARDHSENNFISSHVVLFMSAHRKWLCNWRGKTFLLTDKTDCPSDSYLWRTIIYRNFCITCCFVIWHCQKKTKWATNMRRNLSSQYFLSRLGTIIHMRVISLFLSRFSWCMYRVNPNDYKPYINTECIKQIPGRDFCYY